MEEELLKRGEVEKEKEIDTCDSKEKENRDKRELGLVKDSERCHGSLKTLP